MVNLLYYTLDAISTLRKYNFHVFEAVVFLYMFNILTYIPNKGQK